MAAENPGNRATSSPPRSCFNEAAANGRGKRYGYRLAVGEDRGFNEAAANGRGKRVQISYKGEAKLASMRPRRMAAENRMTRWPAARARPLQ